MKKTLSGLALTLLAGTAQAQVFVGVDDGAFQINLYNHTMGLDTGSINQSALSVRGLAHDDTARVLYLSTGAALWRIPYDAPRTPVFVGTFMLSGVAQQVAGGLAWDSSRSLLYGTGGSTATGTTGPRLYEIDTTTAAVTLLRNFTTPDFAGLDYDPVGDDLYATNDSTSTANGFTGVGIYRIDLPITGASTATEIAGYPISSGTTAETDLDGLAVGNGRIYLAEDQEQWLYPYNLESGLYETNILQSFLTSTDEGFSGATYSADLAAAVNPPFDVAMSGVGPADCSVAQGASGDFAYTIVNPGASDVTNAVLTVTFPASVGTVSSVPAGNLVGNVYTINLGTIATSTVANATVTAQATTGGSFTADATVSFTEVDPDTANNTVNLATSVTPPITATATIKALYSTVVTNPSSIVPGHPGRRFQSTAGLDRPFRSLNGQYWIQQVDTDNPDFTFDEMVLLSDNGVLSIVVEGGVTAAGGQVISSFDTVTAVNDSGHWAISGTLRDQPTATDGFIGRWNGSTLEIAIQEGVTPAPVDTGAVAIGDPSSVTISNTDEVSFRSSLLGGVTTSDAGVFRANGTITAGQEGITVPGGTALACSVFDTGAVGAGFYVSADGSQFVWSGTVLEPTFNEVIIKNSNHASGASIVVQEGVALAGTPHVEPAANSTPYFFTYMAPNGDWFAYGAFEQDGATTTSALDDDWAMRNGVVLARTGDPITTGNTEVFDDAAYSQTFFHMHGNNRGDYVIGGLTNAADLNANAVIVLNGTTILAREGDPVDIDGDGDFDEGTYIQTFNDDEAVLLEDAFLCMVELRGHAFVSGCTTTDTDVGQALIRIPFATGPVCGSADFDGDGDTGTDADIEAFFACLGGNCCGTCGSADFDGDGDTGTDADIEAFFRVLGGGEC